MGQVVIFTTGESTYQERTPQALIDAVSEGVRSAGWAPAVAESSWPWDDTYVEGISASYAIGLRVGKDIQGTVELAYAMRPALYIHRDGKEGHTEQLSELRLSEQQWSEPSPEDLAQLSAEVTGWLTSVEVTALRREAEGLCSLLTLTLVENDDWRDWLAKALDASHRLNARLREHIVDLCLTNDALRAHIAALEAQAKTTAPMNAKATRQHAWVIKAAVAALFTGIMTFVGAEASHALHAEDSKAQTSQQVPSPPGSIVVQLPSLIDACHTLATGAPAPPVAMGPGR